MPLTKHKTSIAAKRVYCVCPERYSQLSRNLVQKGIVGKTTIK